MRRCRSSALSTRSQVSGAPDLSGGSQGAGRCARIEATLSAYPPPQPFGHWTVAEFALWPHLAALRPLGFTLDAGKYPQHHAWFTAMRHDPVFADEARRTADFMKTTGTSSSFERTKIFWPGNRIEWLLARGFHNWFFDEIKSGRVLWPD